MAGKEYKARSKTVQKMSRDGLMEENLRTGKTRRAVTGRIDAVRIGDRPMESYANAESLPEERPREMNSRLGRHGLESGDTTGKGIFREGFEKDSGQGNEPGDPGRRKNRGNRGNGKESSFMETPSSLDENIGGTAAAQDDFTDDLENENRFSDRFHQDTYHTSLRQERGANHPSHENGAGGAGWSSGEKGYRGGYDRNTRRTYRKQYAYRRQEDGLRGESPDKGMLPVTDPGSVHENQPAMNENVVEDHAGSPESESGDVMEEAQAPAQTSRRLQQTRGHPYLSAREAALYSEGLHHGGERKHADEPDNSRSRASSRLRETSAEMDGLDGIKGEIQAKRKKERLNQEQRKARDASRLSFDDEGGMVKGSGAGFSRKASVPVKAAAGVVGKTAGAAAAVGRAKLSEAAAEDENAGTQSAVSVEALAENSARSLASRKSRNSRRKGTASRRKGEGRGPDRLLFTEEEDIKAAAGTVKTEKEKKAAVRKFFRKQRQRRMYAAARKEEKTIVTVFREQQSAVSRAASIVRDAIVRNRSALLVLGSVGVIFLLVSTSLASCSALVQGMGHSVISTTYVATDEDIYAVENRYRELEAGLDAQVRRMQETHPTYDEFRFQIDEISHNPYHLISYFTAKYGQFTYEQVKDELEEIFREQYSLTTYGERGVTITETRTVRPGDSLGQVTTSGYCPCEICCGPYAGGTTASGTYPVSDYTIAVDADNPFVPMGTHVIMNGIEYVVEDTGAFDQYGVQFDVYYDYHESALAHGHQVWEATLAEGGGIDELELTTTRTVDRMSVVLTNHDLDTVLQNRMTAEEKVRYTLYNTTYGNRDYLFDLNNLPKYGPASSDYRVPPEALSDERFARMIAEAEKHLGTPYVWGGYSPSGFDCSGFVCWVINHCGKGWDIGRTTAEGIRRQCYYVSPEDARPGDIIFFEHTYECSGASHVGIYVGDGMMIHCGEPVQYTSINTSYWQDHFMEFGRLP